MVDDAEVLPVSGRGNQTQILRFVQDDGALGEREGVPFSEFAGGHNAVPAGGNLLLGAAAPAFPD